jgi:hypothetical protein
MNQLIQAIVNPAQVDLRDRTYIFTFEPIMSQMVQSIRQIGLIQPPILDKISNQPEYRVVSGFKRILALNHLKINSFPALIYEDESEQPNLELFLLNFYENSAIRSLNPIEKSIALNKLKTIFQVSDEELIAEYLPIMSLGSNPKVLENYLPLIQLEDTIKIAVVEDFLSPEFAIHLLCFNQEERLSLFDFFCCLKLGKNQQREFLHLLTDISKKIEKSITEIIHLPLIQSTMNDANLTIPIRVTKLRELFQMLRFPKFAQAEDNFNQLKKQLKLPPNINFRHPPFFENDKYSIEFFFRNQEEFDKNLKLLNNIIEKKKLTKLESLVE